MAKNRLSKKFYKILDVKLINYFKKHINDIAIFNGLELLKLTLLSYEDIVSLIIEVEYKYKLTNDFIYKELKDYLLQFIND